MVKPLAAGERRLDGDAEIVLDLVLSDVLRQEAWPQARLERLLALRGFRGDGAGWFVFLPGRRL